MTTPSIKVDLPIIAEDQPYVSEFYVRYDFNSTSERYPDLKDAMVIISDNIGGIDRIDIRTQTQAKALIAFLTEHMNRLDES